MAAQPVANMYSPANVQDKLLKYDFAELGPLFPDDIFQNQSYQLDPKNKIAGPLVVNG